MMRLPGTDSGQDSGAGWAPGRSQCSVTCDRSASALRSRLPNGWPPARF